MTAVGPQQWNIGLWRDLYRYSRWKPELTGVHYFRKTFNICDKDMVTSLKLNATYDDGMAVYINGVQVAAVGVSGNPPA